MLRLDAGKPGAELPKTLVESSKFRVQPSGRCLRKRQPKVCTLYSLSQPALIGSTRGLSRLGLHGRNGDGIDDVFRFAAAREIVSRLVESL